MQRNLPSLTFWKANNENAQKDRSTAENLPSLPEALFLAQEMGA